MNWSVLIRQAFVILHHVQQKIIPLRECRLGPPLGKYPFVVMLRLSTLLYIPIDLVELILLILIKVTSHIGLVPYKMVIDPEPGVLDAYRRSDREWNIAWLD